MNTSPARPTSRRHRAVGIAALALGLPALAVADCVDTRKATAAEIDFHARALAALTAALPPVPVGGKLQNPDQLPALGVQCQGRTGNFTLEASRFYELNWRKSIVTVTINARQLPANLDHPFEAYGAASPGGNASLKVNNVVWKVSGSDSPMRAALTDAIDRARLQGWVGKPLPSVAESRALAAQAAPVTVAGQAAATPATPAPNAPTMQAVTQPAAAAPAPAAPAPAGAAEPLKNAADAVNQLRGLFSR